MGRRCSEWDQLFAVHEMNCELRINDLIKEDSKL